MNTILKMVVFAAATVSSASVDVTDQTQYHYKLAQLDHKLNAIQRMRQYSRKQFVGNHRLDSVNMINIEDVTKAYTNTMKEGTETLINH